MRTPLALVTLVLLGLACADDAISPPAVLSIQKAPTASGDGQVDTVFATLAPFRVLVSRGTAPARDVPVSWTVTSDSSRAGGTTTTDASGIASLRLTFDERPREYTVEASLSEASGSPVSFSATATPASPTRLHLVSGNNQEDTTNARLLNDYTVRVTDSYDNSVAGVVVDWAVTAGGGSITPTRTTTSTEGYASARHTLGPEEGEQTVTATASALSSAPHVAFKATAYGMGNLEITTTTGGVDLDPNGYRVTVDGSVVDTTVAVAANETVTIRLRRDDYSVSLRGMAVNCDATSAGPATVTVPSGGTAAVAFDVACATVTQLAFAGTVDDNSDIYVINANGTGVTRLTMDPAADLHPAWSPGASRIAFQTNRDGNAEVYVMNSDGTIPVSLTNNAAWDYQPSWSPDGGKIAFVSQRDDRPYGEMYVMNGDGSDPVRLTPDTDPVTCNAHPAWSPDGSRIAFSSGGCGQQEIYVINVDGSGLTRLTSNDVQDDEPTWSPDGSKIAFSRSTSCGYYGYGCGRDIYVMNADGSGATQVTASGLDDYHDPAWSPDGRWIAFAAATCDYSYGYYYYYCYSYSAYVVKAVTADGARVEQITNGSGFSPAWRP